MDKISEFIGTNSGLIIGTIATIIGTLTIRFFIKRNKQSQKIGKNSTGYQSGGDINIGTPPKKK